MSVGLKTAADIVDILVLQRSAKLHWPDGNPSTVRLVAPVAADEPSDDMATFGG